MYFKFNLFHFLSSALCSLSSIPVTFFTSGFGSSGFGSSGVPSPSSVVNPLIHTFALLL